ncbi:MAG: single-stranded DNA-binding protein [Actinomycetota bacterium]
MSDINRVVLTGRLTADPELRPTSTDERVARLRVAVNGRARDEEGAWTERPAFFDVVVFGVAAETAAAFLRRGRRIGVDGRLAWREWRAEDGSRRQAIEVIARELSFLDAATGGERPAAA